VPRRRRQRWGIGDWFCVPLRDGSNSLGQVVEHRDLVFNSVLCAFFPARYREAEFHIDQESTDGALLSLLLVTRDLLDAGVWLVVAPGQPVEFSRHIDLAALRARRFVGVDIIGSGIIINFLEAYHGLYPWNGFHRPDYLDGLLISPDRKPANIVLK
jgi:hypothetical protein